MQITLNIDSANLGGTVEQVFATLSEADKKDLAKQVMLGVLTEPLGAERVAFEKQVIDGLIQEYQNDSYSSNRIATEEQARNHYKYRERMAKFVSSSERLVKEITSTATRHYTDLVTTMVKEDPQTQELFSAMREEFVNEFPRLVQMAMASHFASQMGHISSAIQTATGAQVSVSILADNLRARLSQQGITI